MNIRSNVSNLSSKALYELSTCGASKAISVNDLKVYCLAINLGGGNVMG